MLYHILNRITVFYKHLCSVKHPAELQKLNSRTINYTKWRNYTVLHCFSGKKSYQEIPQYSMPFNIKEIDK